MYINAIYRTTLTDCLVESGQDDSKYYNIYELPGFTKDEIQIELENNFLLINASNKKRKIKQNYRLNDDIALDKISAKLQDGILTIEMGRKEPQRKKITIN